LPDLRRFLRLRERGIIAAPVCAEVEFRQPDGPARLLVDAEQIIV
jgi:hypothetical protein